VKIYDRSFFSQKAAKHTVKSVLCKCHCRWKWSFWRPFMLWGYADVNDIAALSVWFWQSLTVFAR